MTEFTGRTVAEAIEKGLESLSLTQNDVEIEIIEEGRGGVFGLGSKQAEVRIIPRTEQSAEPPSQAVQTQTAAPDLEKENRQEKGDSSSTDRSSGANLSVDEPKDQHGQEADNSPIPSPVAKSTSEMAEAVSKPEEDEILDICKEFLQSTLDLMGLKTVVEVSYEEPKDEAPTYLLNIEGEDLGILIGRRGETLEAIQYLVRLVVNRHTHSWPRIEVDVEHYKQRRTVSLQRLAETMADRAVRENQTFAMEAMPGRERRLIHLTLRNREDVYTESIGEGDSRKVTIVPS